MKVVVEQREGASIKTTEYEYALGKLKLVNAKLARINDLEENLK